MGNKSKENEVKYMLDIIPSAEERGQIHQRLRDLPENESL